MLTLQLLANGLALGAAYALCALGFVLVLNATGAVNFTQGDMVMAGGFAAIAVAAKLAPFWPEAVPGLLVLPVVVVGMALLGVVFSLFAYFPLKSRPPVATIISTIALGIVFQNAANAIWGPEPRAAPPLLDATLVRLGDLAIPKQSLAVIGVASALIVGQHLLFARTPLGRRMRATAQDRDMAAAVGIDVNAMIALTFALATALAGAAGALLSNTFFVTPSDGTNYIVKAYIAVTIGGWGSIAGAVSGALLIALFEVIFPALPLIVPVLFGSDALGWLFSQTAASILLYAAVLAILFFRPQGLFGETVQRRA
jgi:branched-chain amino acid transport system permease protein